MHAVEFETDTENGIIVIPEAYRHTLPSKHLRVILLSDEPRQSTLKMPQGFQNPVEVPSYKMIAEREEIYGR